MSRDVREDCGSPIPAVDRGGAFGEVYVHSKIIVSGDAAATARNINVSDSLYRMGFASYLVEAVCGVAELFYFSVPLILRNADYLKSFPADQRNISGCCR
jgi:hypothetical protein